MDFSSYPLSRPLFLHLYPLCFYMDIKLKRYIDNVISSGDSFHYSMKFDEEIALHFHIQWVATHNELNPIEAFIYNDLVL